MNFKIQHTLAVGNKARKKRANTEHPSLVFVLGLCVVVVYEASLRDKRAGQAYPLQHNCKLLMCNTPVDKTSKKCRPRAFMCSSLSLCIPMSVKNIEVFDTSVRKVLCSNL